MGRGAGTGVTQGCALQQEHALAGVAGESQPLEQYGFCTAASFKRKSPRTAACRVVADRFGEQRIHQFETRPPAGPKAMLTATARFSSTTGDGMIWASAS